MVPDPKPPMVRTLAEVSDSIRKHGEKPPPSKRQKPPRVPAPSRADPGYALLDGSPVFYAPTARWPKWLRYLWRWAFRWEMYERGYVDGIADAESVLAQKEAEE